MLKLLNNKLLGGTLLLTGTAIGGGLLALPIATAEAGFLNALILTIGCWVLMTSSALLTLEVSLRFPTHANIISMTEALLNRWGTLVAWVSYLLLLYSVVAAYIAAGADFLTNLGQYYLSSQILQPISAILFTALLGSIVYRGIVWVDYLNRGLMLIKLTLYSLLVILVLPHLSPEKLLAGDISYFARGFGVLVTSFAYNNIIPSLRSYFEDDIKSLRKAILIGSTIPLICYTLWNMSVMGLIPLHGETGLIKLSQSDYATSALINQLNHILKSRLLFFLSHSFACVCVFTTFLTCSLGLADFLADGFKLTKQATLKGDSIIYSATFVPPLLIALFFPGIFIKALNYAGIYCLVLFILLPVIMAWRSRYTVHQSTLATYQLPGGKTVLISLGITAILGVFYSLYRVLA